MRSAIVLGVLPLLFSLTAHAAGIDPPQVTVFGTATTEVVPDMMVWHLRIQDRGPSPAQLAENHAVAVLAVLGFLKDQGLPEEDIQTSGMELRENWEYRNQSKVREGYLALTEASFKVHGLRTYEDLWIGLSRLAQVTIDGVYYDHSKRIDYQNDTRAKALLAAKQKAASLAITLGAEIGEPLLIEEDPAEYESRGPGLPAWTNARVTDEGAGQSAGALAPGRIPIRMRVKATFRLLAPGK